MCHVLLILKLKLKLEFDWSKCWNWCFVCLRKTRGVLNWALSYKLFFNKIYLNSNNFTTFTSFITIFRYYY
ncbi:unnamed protein product [Blepharisma stoltei]|uniref:Uncharacterized protein n=1 Tax=Blepharisma stoltei TaxID=1481888 RepID=A0AAU9JNB1_9CILI|nr:unnamed protein product [Blepharisma stoltei]